MTRHSRPGRMAWGLIRRLVGATIEAVIDWQLGTAPFLNGLRAVDGRSLAVACGRSRGTFRWAVRVPGAWARRPPAADVASAYGCGRCRQRTGRRSAVERSTAARSVTSRTGFRTSASGIRDGLAARRVGSGVALASVVVVTGHETTLLLAAYTAGANSPVVLPLAVLVLLATVVPNVGGWGPREGVAAWAFGAAGLGAAQGLATTTVYAVLSLAAISPGAPLLAATWLRRHRSAADPLEHVDPTIGPDLVPDSARSEAGCG